MRNLFIISFLVFSFSALASSQALAMGGPAPKKPEYKLEVLKLEVVRQPSTLEAK